MSQHASLFFAEYKTLKNALGLSLSQLQNNVFESRAELAQSMNFFPSKVKPALLEFLLKPSIVRTSIHCGRLLHCQLLLVCGDVIPGPVGGTGSYRSLDGQKTVEQSTLSLHSTVLCCFVLQCTALLYCIVLYSTTVQYCPSALCQQCKVLLQGCGPWLPSWVNITRLLHPQLSTPPQSTRTEPKPSHNRPRLGQPSTPKLTEKSLSTVQWQSNK